MARIFIEVTPEQHQRLKAFAALRGQSIEEYVLEQTLPPEADNNQLFEEDALHALEAFLKPRIERAESGEIV
ncbi:MAG: antitoxin, partial [Candidatus Entotheonella factor]